MLIYARKQLFIGVLGVMIAANLAVAQTNLVTQTNGVSATATGTNSPVAQELQKIEDQDDAAAAEIDGWIRKETRNHHKKASGIPDKEFNRRIRDKLDISKQAHLGFHPETSGLRTRAGGLRQLFARLRR